MTPSDQEAIKHVIEKAYIQGIHGTQDVQTVNSGFHPAFAMLVQQGEQVDKVPVAEWLPRVEQMKADNPAMWAAETRHQFVLVDVTGNAAVAKLIVHKGDTYFSTDFMLLYKFENGWQIVSKIYTTAE